MLITPPPANWTGLRGVIVLMLMLVVVVLLAVCCKSWGRCKLGVYCLAQNFAPRNLENLRHQNEEATFLAALPFLFEQPLCSVWCASSGVRSECCSSTSTSTTATTTTTTAISRTIFESFAGQKKVDYNGSQYNTMHPLPLNSVFFSLFFFFFFFSLFASSPSEFRHFLACWIEQIEWLKEGRWLIDTTNLVPLNRKLALLLFLLQTIINISFEPASNKPTCWPGKQANAAR